MRIREATRADAHAIAALHADSWRKTYRGAYSDEYLDNLVFEDRQRVWQERLSAPLPNQYVVVAEQNGEIASFACAYGERDAQLGTLLDNLHVRSNYHGSGIGRRLLIEIAEWSSRKYGKLGLWLGVLEQNQNAQRFYQKLGAIDVGGRVVNPPGGGSTLARNYAWTADQVAELA
ncbi:MAG TPA: GNAT family N-acetyltransferase [Dehalococcoidia bacterium]|nr:GNAT family N-acetyltransferase [Dehalococcoidia bacterium]